jgi:hypothetical protein
MRTSSSVASPTIKSRYANIFVFIDCENNQFLKKWIMTLQFSLKLGLNKFYYNILMFKRACMFRPRNFNVLRGYVVCLHLRFPTFWPITSAGVVHKVTKSALNLDAIKQSTQIHGCKYIVYTRSVKVEYSQDKNISLFACILRMCPAVVINPVLFSYCILQYHFWFTDILAKYQRPKNL